MTVYVQADTVKHVDLEKFADRIDQLVDKLSALSRVIKESETLDIGMLDLEFMDVWCGDTVDECQIISQQFNKLLAPYKNRLLKDFKHSVR